MKNLLSILILFLSFSHVLKAEKADTVDSFHLYINGIEVHPNKNGVVVLKRESIKAGDSLTLRYSNDTPCSCPVYFTVEDDKDNVFASARANRTFHPLSISLHQLRMTGRTEFILFYFEDELPGRSHKHPFCGLIFE